MPAYVQHNFMNDITIGDIPYACLQLIIKQTVFLRGS